MKTINIGVAGLGTVGSGVAEIFCQGKHFDIPIRLAKAAEADSARRQSVKLDKSVLINDARQLIDDPVIDIVVELIGGCGIAKEIVLGALKNGKAVVTANKALLAKHGEEIFSAVKKYDGDIYYEASVAGGIPIIKIFREGLIANKINSIFGIVNGTCNYILTKMKEDGANFSEALTGAQKEGYAEKDPTLDIEGFDSAHKLVILSSLALGAWINPKDVYTEGISRLTHSDIIYASELGYVIKLLAIYKNNKEGVEVRVHPTLLPENHVLSSVNGVFNAIFVKGDNVGDQLFYGRGAGKLPTASAVVADILDVARNLSSGTRRRLPVINTGSKNAKVVPIEKVVNKCYLRFTTLDRPGVLAKIAGILGRNRISIESVIQKGKKETEPVHIVIMTHVAVEKDIRKAIGLIDKMPEVKAKTMMMRVEE